MTGFKLTRDSFEGRHASDESIHSQLSVPPGKKADDCSEIRGADGVAGVRQSFAQLKGVEGTAAIFVIHLENGLWDD